MCASGGVIAQRVSPTDVYFHRVYLSRCLQRVSKAVSLKGVLPRGSIRGFYSEGTLKGRAPLRVSHSGSLPRRLSDDPSKGPSQTQRTSLREYTQEGPLRDAHSEDPLPNQHTNAPYRIPRANYQRSAAESYAPGSPSAHEENYTELMNEIKLLSSFMPTAPTPEAIQATIDEIVAGLSAEARANKAATGTVMRALWEKLGEARAAVDKKDVAARVSQALKQ